MCGIAAIFSRQAPVAAATIERATRSLYHRGPDGQRHWISADGRVALGHARLSIIDLATGDQPIASEDERTRIVVNGEFYDFEAIQHELERGGHRLRTRSDSEIALHLYEDLGLQCVHRLRGEFAIVLWDERNRTHLRRPRSLRHQAAVLRVARWRAVSGLGGQGAVRGRRAGALGPRCGLRNRSSSAGRQASTLFDGVCQVPPGHYLIATDRHVQLHQYWDFNYRAAADVRQRPADEYVAEFRACARRGGPAAVAGRRAGRLLSQRRARFLRRDRPGRPASSRSDPGLYADLRSARLRRRREAREMATRVGAEFHPIPIGQDDLADHLADAVHQAETVLLNAHGVAKYLLSRAVRDAGYKVVITGEGSDEILGGYPHFRRDMLMYNREGQDPDSPGRDARSSWKRSTRSHAACCCRTARANRSTMSSAGSASSRRGWRRSPRAAVKLRRPVLAGLCAALWIARELQRAAERARRAGASSSGRDPVHQSLYLWSKTVPARLHPHRARRSHGDGALHRRARAVPRPSRRRGASGRSR